MRPSYGLSFLAFLLLFAAAVLAPAQSPTKTAGTKAARTDAFGDPLPEGVLYRLGTTRLRHNGITSMHFSGDGKRLLTLGDTDGIQHWDLVSGSLIQSLRHVEGSVIASPDDRYFAVLVSGRAHLYDKASGKKLAEWTHEDGLKALAFSVDGKTLLGLSPGLGQSPGLGVCRWNVARRMETGRRALLEVPSSSYRLSNWHFSPDGTVVASQSSYGDFTNEWHFWDTATGKPCRQPFVTAPGLRCWSADGKLFATGQGSIEVWDTTTGKQVLPVEVKNNGEVGTPKTISAEAVAFHSNGKSLAHAQGWTVILRDLASGDIQWKTEVSQRIGRLTFSPDGKILAVAGQSAIILLDSSTGGRTGFSRHDPGLFRDLGERNAPRFTGAGRYFFAVQDGQLAAYNPATGKAIRSFAQSNLLALSPDGARAAFMYMGRDEVYFYVADFMTGKELWRREREIYPFFCTFPADVKVLAFSSGNKLHLLNASTGHEIKRLEVPIVTFNESLSGFALTVAPDLKKVAVSPHDADCIQIWDVATGKKVREWKCPANWCRFSLHFLPDGQRLVGAASLVLVSGTIGGANGVSNHNIPQIEQTCIWDAADGRKLVGFAESFCGLSADGRWLALAGDNNIQLRHTDSGRLQATVPWCHFRGFSPDGSLLVANDDTCHELGVWEVTTGRLLRKWRDPGLKFQHASYSPDGRTVLAATDHGTMLLYDATGLASAPGELPSFKLTASDIDRLWKDLGSTDGTRIHQAIWALAAGGDATVKGLQKRLQPVQRLDPKLAAELLGNLDSDRYAIREKAMTQLQRLENAQPVLEDVLTKQPTLEMRLRIELILGKLPELPWDDELLRNCRAVAVLEQIGTPHAREVLAGLSAGFPQARLTKAARAALERLTRK